MISAGLVDKDDQEFIGNSDSLLSELIENVPMFQGLRMIISANPLAWQNEC